MTRIATKPCMCNRCGSGIKVGDIIRFEPYQTRGYRKTGSGRTTGGGQIKFRPIHGHDCDGWDALQEKARRATEEYNKSKDRQ